MKFDLVINSQNERGSVNRKLKTIIKTFDLVAKFIKTFDLLPKKSFDLLPNLRQSFDLLKRPSEIRSSDQLPKLPIGGVSRQKKLLKFEKKIQFFFFTNLKFFYEKCFFGLNFDVLM